MVNISGTWNADTISVENNIGTLNGVVQGSPIGDIGLRSDGSTLTIEDSSVGQINTATPGFDTANITVKDSTISSINISQSTKLTLTNTDVTGALRILSGDVEIEWKGGTLGGIFKLGVGGHKLSFRDVEFTSPTFSIGLGSPPPEVTFDDVTFPAGTKVNFSGGNPVVEILGDTKFGAGSSINTNNGGELLIPKGSVVVINSESYIIGTDTIPQYYSGLPGKYMQKDGTLVSFKGFTTIASSSPVCFTTGTRILTTNGYIAVENLRLGDRLKTAEGDEAALIWIGRMDIVFSIENSVHRPVEFKTGSLGPGLPDRPLIVSPQHRILLHNATSDGRVEQVLAPAKGLLDIRGVRVCKGMRRVTYFALLLERHSVIFANGVKTESYFPGEASMNFIGPRLRRGLCTALQKLGRDYGPPARPCLTVSETRKKAAVTAIPAAFQSAPAIRQPRSKHTEPIRA